jgi:hypothetical protein
MAEAKKVLKEVTVKTVKPMVELSLSYEEAEVLAIILSLVAGVPDKTMRGEADAINQALKRLDIRNPALNTAVIGEDKIIADRNIRYEFYEGDIHFKGNLEDFRKALTKARGEAK